MKPANKVVIGHACWNVSEQALYWINAQDKNDESSTIRMTKKQLLLLECLYEAYPTPLDRASIEKKVWQSRPISQESVPQLVSKTRITLRDNDKSIITHIRNAGYVLNFEQCNQSEGNIIEKNKTRLGLKRIKINLKSIAYMTLILQLLILTIGGYTYREKIKALESISAPHLISRNDSEIKFKIEDHICRFDKLLKEAHCEDKGNNL